MVRGSYLYDSYILMCGPCPGALHRCCVDPLFVPRGSPRGSPSRLIRMSTEETDGSHELWPKSGDESVPATSVGGGCLAVGGGCVLVVHGRGCARSVEGLGFGV